MSKRELERKFRERLDAFRGSPLFPKKKGRELDDTKRFITMTVLEEALSQRAA